MDRLCQRDAEAALEKHLRLQARYAERVAKGDETVIKASGFSTAATPVRSRSSLDAPTRLSATEGDHAGELGSGPMA